MLWRACFMGVYGAATVLVVVLWLLDYKGEPSIPMLFGVLGYDAFLLNRTGPFGEATSHRWPWQYYLVAVSALALFVGGLGLYPWAVRRITHPGNESRLPFHAEALVRSCLVVLLLTAVISAVLADRWTDFFFVPRSLLLCSKWEVRPARVTPCFAAAAAMIVAWLIAWPILQWRHTPSMRRVKVHLTAITIAAAAVGLFGLLKWGAANCHYFSPWKTVTVLAGAAAFFGVGSLILLMKPSAPVPEIPLTSVKFPSWLRRILAILITFAVLASFCTVGSPSFLLFGYSSTGPSSWLFHPYGPIPLLLTAFGVWGVTTVTLAWRRYQHLAIGLCTQCDYDLRGTIAAGRSECPECGATIDPPTPTT